MKKGYKLVNQYGWPNFKVGKIYTEMNLPFDTTIDDFAEYHQRYPNDWIVYDAEEDGTLIGKSNLTGVELTIKYSRIENILSLLTDYALAAGDDITEDEDYIYLKQLLDENRL